MKKKKLTIWKTRDRQGTKYFKERPTYLEGFGLFSGERIEPNFAKRERYRIVGKFRLKFEVMGGATKTAYYEYKFDGGR